MVKVIITPKNHTNKDNDNFVGMKFVQTEKDAEVEAFFPIGYDFLRGVESSEDLKSENTQKHLKKELHFLLKTIQKHSNTKQDSLQGHNYNEQSFPYDAYITIIKMFLQYGYYIEKERTYQKAARGKINWKRTIAQIKPMLQGNSPVYLDFIVRKNQKSIDNLIFLIHQWCVYEAFSKFGFLFVDSMPSKPILKIDESNKTSFLIVLQKALSETFNDKNKLLFSSMIAMLKLKKSKSNQPFFFGTTSFHNVWENVVDRCFGSVFEHNKKEYYPPAEWVFIKQLNKAKKNHLIPDTIMFDNEENIYLIDSKYYNFEDNYSLPSAADINKQIAYGNHAYKKHFESKNEHNKKAVYNSFLIPYNFEKDEHKLGTKAYYEKDKIENMQTNSNHKNNSSKQDTSNKIPLFYIGYATLDNDNNANKKAKHENILGVLIDTKWLLKEGVNMPKYSNITQLSGLIKKSYPIKIEKYLTKKQNDVFLVLTGLGGSVKGYENKYEQIAKIAQKNFGFNVFVVATPHGVYENDSSFLNEVFAEIYKEMERQDYNVYVMGHSAGGTIALWNLNEFTNIKRLIAVNPVLNVNFHKVQNSAKLFKGDFIKVIIGEKDSSYKFYSLLKSKAPNIIVETLKDTDHEFRGKLNDFISLPEKHLFL